MSECALILIVSVVGVIVIVGCVVAAIVTGERADRS